MSNWKNGFGWRTIWIVRLNDMYASLLPLEVPASWTGRGEVHLLSQLLGIYCRLTLQGSLGNWLMATLHKYHSSRALCICSQMGCLEARSHQHPGDCNSSLMTLLLGECSEEAGIQRVLYRDLGATQAWSLPPSKRASSHFPWDWVNRNWYKSYQGEKGQQRSGLQFLPKLFYKSELSSFFSCFK